MATTSVATAAAADFLPLRFLLAAEAAVAVAAEVAGAAAVAGVVAAVAAVAESG